jgi:hypothetical protein
MPHNGHHLLIEVSLLENENQNKQPFSTLIATSLEFLLIKLLRCFTLEISYVVYLNTLDPNQQALNSKFIHMNDHYYEK